MFNSSASLYQAKVNETGFFEVNVHVLRLGKLPLLKSYKA